jgi:adenylate kinase
MNIFVSGVHGVGKTYLADRLPSGIGLFHMSASRLIKEERSLPDWSSDKRVSGVDENQVALANGVARYNRAGTHLLLDGHFVLLDQDGQFIALGSEVFNALNLSAVVLIEAEPEVVARRVMNRDALPQDPTWIAEFMVREHSQAELVCRELQLPLIVLASPDPAKFANAVGVAAQQHICS